MTQSELEFRRFDHSQAQSMRELAADIYRDSYGVTAEADGFRSVHGLLKRFDAYTGRAGFDYLLAYQDGQSVGQAFGWPLGVDTGWWTGLDGQLEPDFAIEDGLRTFALSEIMVRASHTGQGIAHALHDELLRPRPESRATLLVRPTNTAAYQAYARWGWRKAAQLTPGWDDAPTFDVLILPLPV